MSEYCESLSAEYELVGVKSPDAPITLSVPRFIHPIDRYPPRV